MSRRFVLASEGGPDHHDVGGIEGRFPHPRRSLLWERRRATINKQEPSGMKGHGGNMHGKNSSRTGSRHLAKFRFLCALVALTASITGMDGGESASLTQIKSVDDVIALIPKDDARDLEKKSKEESAARAISTHLYELIGGKTATLELTVDRWKPFQDHQGNAFQLRPNVYEFRVGGVRFGMEFWVYLIAESAPDLEKLKNGDKCKVTGIFEHVEVTASQGPRLHINLRKAAVVPK